MSRKLSTRLLPVSASIGILMVGACALPTTEKYRAQLDEWVGGSVDSLVLKWGPPNSSFTLGNGDSLLEFARSDIEIRGGDDWITSGRTRRGFSRDGIPRAWPPYAVTFYCKTRFLVSPDGVVKSYSLEGNDCAAY